MECDTGRAPKKGGLRHRNSLLEKKPSERASMLEVPLFLIPTFIRRRRITPDCETTS